MSRYQLVSHWLLDAPVETVWRAITDVPVWPRWWRYVIGVEELERGDATGLGAAHRVTLGTTVPYELSFTMRRSAVTPLQRIDSFFEGELTGAGSWTFQPQGSSTAVRHDWDVTTTPTWMNVMSPVLGPMFRWNHGRVMADGAQGLARYLASR